MTIFNDFLYGVYVFWDKIGLSDFFEDTGLSDMFEGNLWNGGGDGNGSGNNFQATSEDNKVVSDAALGVAVVVCLLLFIR